VRAARRRPALALRAGAAPPQESRIDELLTVVFGSARIFRACVLERPGASLALVEAIGGRQRAMRSGLYDGGEVCGRESVRISGPMAQVAMVGCARLALPAAAFSIRGGSRPPGAWTPPA